MKKIAIIFFLTIFSLTVLAEELIFVRDQLTWGIMNTRGEMVQPCIYQEYFKINTTPLRIAVRKNNCWGILNENGIEIIAPQYVMLIWHPEMGNYIKVRSADSVYFKNGIQYKNSKYGIIDVNGKIILPIVYDVINYSNYFFNAGTGVLNVSENSYSGGTGTWINFDCKTSLITPDPQCKAVYPEKDFSYGYIKIKSSEGKLGLINCERQQAISTVNDDIKPPIVSGWVAVNAGAKPESIFSDERIGGKWGVSDFENKKVVETIYEDIQLLRNGNIAFTKDSRNWGVMDRNKKIIIPEIYERIEELHDYYKVSKNGTTQWYLLNKEGKNIIDKAFYFVSIDQSKKLLILGIDNKNVQFMNKDCRFSLPLQIEDFSFINRQDSLFSGICFSKKIYVTKELNVLVFDNFIKDKNAIRVKIADKWGIIKPDGSWFIKPDYDSLLSSNDGLIWAKKNNLWNIINLKGEKPFSVPANITSMQPFSCGLALVSINGKLNIFGKLINDQWRYLDVLGNIVIKCNFKDAISFKNNIAFVKAPYQDNEYVGYKWIMINIKGEIIGNRYFDEVVY